jgi:uncharacterized radical SAM superfamily Fe-S cluster-containing enzyme
MQPDANTMVLDTTESVCPVCLKVVKAQIIAQGKEIYMEKACPEHGPVKAYLWPDREHYNWMRNFSVPTKRPEVFKPSQQGCPNDCGLCSGHRRHPTLVEIEVTERCNLRCPVCFMAAEEVQAAAQLGPSLPEFERKYKEILQKTSPQTSIQLTGGEPTVRQDLPEIVRLGRKIGFEAIEVNTNGLVIGKDPAFIVKLAAAGISGIYLQFDGLTGDVYRQIRGENLLAPKLQAIENCRQAGVQVVLAMTVIDGINDRQIGDVLSFALQNRDVVAGIAYQPAFGSGRFDVAMTKRLTMGDVIFLLAEQSNGLIRPYDLWPLGCSHSLCSSSTYLVEQEGEFRPITQLITPQEYRDNFSPDSPQGSVLADIAFRKNPDLSPGLTIVIMNYMDAVNLDLKKMRECSMLVVGKDDGLIPFCKYQLSSMDPEKQREADGNKGKQR